MADTTTKLSIVIDAENRADAAFKQLNDQIKGTNDRMANIVDISKKVAAAGAVAFAAISGVIYTTVEAASAAQVKMAQFNTTLATMGDVGAKAKDALLATAKAAIKMGFDDEDSATSLAKLFQRTKDVTQAQQLFNLSMDLARAKNVDLSTATGLVNMALSGQGRALLQYGIVIKDTATPLEALQVLQEKVGGQAIAFSETFAGKMATLTVETDNLKESIGNALLPILTELLKKIEPVIEKVTEWIEKNPKLTEYILLGSLALAGMVTALGLIGVVLPTIIAGMGFLATGIALVGTAAVPMAALAVALVAVYDAYQNLKGVQQGTLDSAKNTRESAKLLLPLIAKETDPARKAMLEKEYNESNAAAGNAETIGNMGFWQSLGYGVNQIATNATDLSGLDQGRATTAATAYNFTFNGDVNDKDALIKSVSDMLDRKSNLKMIGAN